MTPRKPMRFGEFIAMCALMFATVAYSTDSMLPLLVDMGNELSPANPERAQLVIASFMLGLGLGTFVAGPISDALGRKTVILSGIALYMLAALAAGMAQSMTLLLLARFVQGLGTACPRVVTQALIRDQYAGRQMARVVSLAMTIFVLVPTVAPFVGAQLGALFGWRAIFYSFLVFGSVSAAWLFFRQPETLAPENRRSLRLGPVVAAFAEVFRNRLVMLYLVSLTCAFATMLVWLSTVAVLFEGLYDRADSFPMWFALCALLSFPASLINATLVVRLGMRRLIIAALAVQIALASVVALVALGMGASPFWLFMAFMVGHFFTVGLLFSNLNALALEPLGHIAGTASSVMGGISTMLAALIAAPLSQIPQTSLLPLSGIVVVFGGIAMGAMMVARRIAPRR